MSDVSSDASNEGGEGYDAVTAIDAVPNAVQARKIEREQSTGFSRTTLPPSIDIALRPHRFVFLVLILCAIIAAFTAVTTRGIVLQHVYDVIGSSKVADDRTETYNTWSGLVLALVEVLVGGHMNAFMPVFDVYLHNTLWKLGAVMSELEPPKWRKKKNETVADVNDKSSAPPSKPSTPVVQTTTLFLFPLIIALTFGNSIRSLQASNSTVGFESIIIAPDLAKDQSKLDALVAKAASKADGLDNSTYNTVLKNAIRQRATPFQFASDSSCTQKDATLVAAGERTVPINVHDLDTSSVVYGFTLRDWNAEAITHALPSTQSVSISYFDAKNNEARSAATAAGIAALTEDMLLATFQMFMHGTIMIEKAVGDATNQNHSCELSDHNRAYGLQDSGGRRLSSDDGDNADEADLSIYEGDDSYGQWTYDENGTRICQGPISSLISLLGSPAAEAPTVANMMDAIVSGLNTSFPDTFALEETAMTIESYNITSQISLKVLQIDAVVGKSLEYGVSECTLDSADQSTCNVSNYVYSDWSNAFCGDDNCVFLDISETFVLQKEIGLVPVMLECEDIAYSGDYKGFYPVKCSKSTNSTFLYGIGSHITGDAYGSNAEGVGLPFITAPRRHVTFSFGIMSWKLEDLAAKFGAECKATDQCQGLWYKLESSGRFLFAGESALPRSRILRADFHSPVQLVQLNAPSIFVPKWNMSLELDRLSSNDFPEMSWGDSLSGENCSMLMQSYIEQVEENRYFLDHPLQPMYTSAFYYLMAGAAVTDTSSSSTNIKDALGDSALKGDQQVRAAKIAIPLASFKVSVAGCCFLVGAMIVILAIPKRYSVQPFDSGISAADKYLAMRSEGEYSDTLYRKMIVVGDGTKTRVPGCSLEVTSMTLSAVTGTGTKTDKIRL